MTRVSSCLRAMVGWQLRDQVGTQRWLHHRSSGYQSLNNAAKLIASFSCLGRGRAQLMQRELEAGGAYIQDKDRRGRGVAHLETRTIVVRASSMSSPHAAPEIPGVNVAVSTATCQFPAKGGTTNRHEVRAALNRRHRAPFPFSRIKQPTRWSDGVVMSGWRPFDSPSSLRAKNSQNAGETRYVDDA
jgi:hypothetical protein